MTGVQYGGPKPALKRVYYVGDDTYALQIGEVLCYKYDASAPSAGTDKTDDLGVAVIRAASTNLVYFAGIVDGSYAGKKDSGWIDIIVPQPGDVLPVLINGATTAAYKLKVKACSTSTAGALEADNTSTGTLLTSIAQAIEANDTGVKLRMTFFY